MRKLPQQALLDLHADLQPRNPRRQQTDHLSGPLLFGSKGGMAQKSADVFRRLDHWAADYHDAVIGMTQAAKEETFVTGNECRILQVVEVAEEFPPDLATQDAPLRDQSALVATGPVAESPPAAQGCCDRAGSRSVLRLRQHLAHNAFTAESHCLADGLGRH